MVRGVVLLILLLGSRASADSFKERLTKEEIAAAAKAARDGLPPVDQEAAKKCKQMPLGSATEKGAAASCYRAAGSLGAAITLWKHVADESGAADPAREALRELGPALEAAGMFHDAASFHATYARRHGGEKDAAERLIRAICAWRQLGDVTNAERGFSLLERLMKKAKPDSATLCDAVRPITPPKPEP